MNWKKNQKIIAIALSFWLIFLLSSPVLATSVIPTEGFSSSLGAGSSDSAKDLNVTVSATGMPLDVLFAFDLTSSMAEEIAACKSTSQSIMNSIKSSYADTQFGVASAMDYSGTFVYPGYTDQYGDVASGDYPWKLDQDIISNTATVTSKINALTLGWGADIPEDYSRVLYESQFVGWRENAIRVVVFMGDAPVHDLDFYSGYNTGGDPGRDNIALTADDLDFQDVVAQLKSSGIYVVAIDTADNSHAAESFQYMATQTEGLYRQIADAGDIPETIVNAVKTTAKLSTLTLSPQSGYDAWMSYTPTSYTDVADGTTKTFQVTIKAPSDVCKGTYTFNIDVYGTGAGGGSTKLATVPVTVEVTSSEYSGCLLPKTGGTSTESNFWTNIFYNLTSLINLR